MTKIKQLSIFSIMVLSFSLAVPSFNVAARPRALGTSPVLSALLNVSVLGGGQVTNTGSTTTWGDVDVSPGSAITNFPPGIAAGDNSTHLHIPPAADAAQAEALSVFGALDQTCDTDWTGTGLVDLGGMNLVPGVYCADSLGLTGVLTLSGGAADVYIFKSVSTLVTASGSSVVGGDPCNIWWRIGSSTTLGTTTSFVGTVISQNGANAMTTNATLNGRFLGLSAATVSLDSNTITAPVCLAAPTSVPGGGGVSGLPNTGGAPIRNDEAFPWSLVLVIVAGFGAIALFLGVRAYRRTNLPK